MALKHFLRSNFIEPERLEDSDFLTFNRKKMGIKLYNMALRIFTTFIENQNVNKSAGYFHFGMVIGNSGLAPKKDVDYLWNRMAEIYGDDEVSQSMIGKILGTICMLCVISDPRPWVYKDDMERQEKLDKDEIPNANEYFIGDYEIPYSKNNSTEEEIYHNKLKLLKKKFKGNRNE